MRALDKPSTDHFGLTTAGQMSINLGNTEQQHFSSESPLSQQSLNTVTWSINLKQTDRSESTAAA
jgi:hypothetical protein